LTARLTQAVLRNNTPDLLHLIGFGFTVRRRLNVDNLDDTLTIENEMVAFDTLLKSHRFQ
jgi:hypothetical protein